MIGVVRLHDDPDSTGAELAKLYALVAPNYAAVIESYQKAQDVAKQPRWMAFPEPKADVSNVRFWPLATFFQTVRNVRFRG
jgi:hypothetical protein